MADNEQKFKALITVVDQATAPLRVIDAQISRMTAPVRRIAAGMALVGRHAGLDKVAHAAHQVGERLAHVGEQVKELVGPLAALGAAGSLAGLVEMQRKASEFGANIFDTSKKTGVAVETLESYRYAAQLAGVATESMDRGLTLLNRNLAQAAAGKNKDMAAMLKHLGISLRDAKGQVRSAADVMPELAEAMRVNENPAIRARIAFAAFGRSGADLIPLLIQGRDRLSEMRAEAERLGYVMSADQVRDAKESEDAWKRLGFAVQGLSNTIGAALFPVLTPLIKQLTELIADNRELVAGKVKEFVEGFAKAMKNIPWGTVLDGMGRFLAVMGEVMSTGTGLIAVVGAMAAVLAGPLLLSLTSATQALAGLGVSVARLGAVGLISAIGAIGNFVTALRAGYTAMAALNLVMAANPIGLIVIAVAALIAVLILVWKYWDEIVEAIKKAIEWTKKFFTFKSEAERNQPVAGRERIASSRSTGGGGAGKPLHITQAGAAATASPPVAATEAQGGAGERRSLPDLPASPEPYRPAPGALNNPENVAALRAAGPGRYGAAGQPRDGQVTVKVDIANAPPGTRVAAKSTGAIPQPKVDVGHAFDGALPAGAY